jgi:hypothetical protein
MGVDRMQRNFEPMRKQVEAWQQSDLRMSLRKWSSMRRSSKEDLKLRSISFVPCTTSTSSRYAFQSIMQSIFNRECGPAISGEVKESAGQMLSVIATWLGELGSSSHYSGNGPPPAY